MLFFVYFEFVSFLFDTFSIKSAPFYLLGFILFFYFLILLTFNVMHNCYDTYLLVLKS